MSLLREGWATRGGWLAGWLAGSREGGGGRGGRGWDERDRPRFSPSPFTLTAPCLKGAAVSSTPILLLISRVESLLDCCYQDVSFLPLSPPF